MDFNRWSSVDPYSNAKPDIAKIVHIHLDLFVDFDETVLRGNAILLIEMKSGYDHMILDMYEFNEDINKISVTDYMTDEKLKYSITKNVDDIGSKKFVIWIPLLYRHYRTKYQSKCRSKPYECIYNCMIQITYETCKGSSALYWLRSDQTSDGTHPMLITNNKFTYARGIFPCQDSPSVRFTYSAEISVPKDFNFVIICGIKSKQIINVGDRNKHIFYEMLPMPSYAIIIMVGSLEAIQLLSYSDDITLWVEKKYIEQSKRTFANFNDVLQIGKTVCGFRHKSNKVKISTINNTYTLKKIDEYNICVLPPNVPEIELQCHSMIFVSSTLFNEHPYIISSTITQKVAQNWAGGLVTCQNFQHLWLNKSFSTIISREIMRSMYNEHFFHNEISFLERKTINDLEIKISLYGTDSQQKLVPNLRDILPKDITKYVLDEIGYFILNCLHSFEGSTVFRQYLQSYMNKFHCKSINTVDWINHLYSNEHFINRHEEIKFILDKWLYGLDLTCIYILYPEFSQAENQCCLLAEQWITTEISNNFYPLLTKLKLYNNLERTEFLTNLYISLTILPIAKLKWLHIVFPLDDQTFQNRCLLLLLYIKNKWLEMVHPALEFARKCCIPMVVCKIFRELYELEETRHLAISGFKVIVEKKCKLLPQTMEEVASILKINLKDIYVLDEENILHVKTGQ